MLFSAYTVHLTLCPDYVFYIRVYNLVYSKYTNFTIRIVVLIYIVKYFPLVIS